MIKDNKTCACGNPKAETALSCPQCNDDLISFLAREMNHSRRYLNPDEVRKKGNDLILAVQKPAVGPVTGRCPFCNESYDEAGGYNVYPFKLKGFACFACFNQHISPTREIILDEDLHDGQTFALTDNLQCKRTFAWAIRD